MGLFSNFSGDTGEKLTPHLAFAVSLIYMMGADGAIDNEEVGHLLSVLGGEMQGGSIGVGAQNRDLIDRAIRIARTTPLDTFLAEAAPILSDAQKICILINLADSSFTDGAPESEEEILFGRFLAAFGIAEERFRPFFQVIAIKNDRRVFTDPGHPSNAPGHIVTIARSSGE